MMLRKMLTVCLVLVGTAIAGSENSSAVGLNLNLAPTEVKPSIEWPKSDSALFDQLTKPTARQTAQDWLHPRCLHLQAINGDTNGWLDLIQPAVNNSFETLSETVQQTTTAIRDQLQMVSTATRKAQELAHWTTDQWNLIAERSAAIAAASSNYLAESEAQLPAELATKYSESSEYEPQPDAYWQYYEDCDRWEIVFTSLHLPAQPPQQAEKWLRLPAEVTAPLATGWTPIPAWWPALPAAVTGHPAAHPPQKNIHSTKNFSNVSLDVGQPFPSRLSSTSENLIYRPAMATDPICHDGVGLEVDPADGQAVIDKIRHWASQLGQQIRSSSLSNLPNFSNACHRLIQTIYY